MNGQAQTLHRTVTQGLDARLSNVEDVVAASLPTLRHAIGDETTHRLAEARDQRSYVDNEDRLLRQRIEVVAQQHKMLEEHYIAFRQRHLTLWKRLGWLLMGE